MSRHGSAMACPRYLQQRTYLMSAGMAVSRQKDAANKCVFVELGLFNHLVGAGEQYRRDGDAERPGGSLGGEEIGFCRLLRRKICRVRPPQDFFHKHSGLAGKNPEDGPQKSQATRLR